MDPKELKSCEPPTVTSFLSQNRELIQEILYVSGQIYTVLTSDDTVKCGNAEPTCIMNDLLMQNENLKMIKELLYKAKEQIV